MGRCVNASPGRQVKSPVLERISVSQQDPREGTISSGLVRGAHPVSVDLLSRVLAPECKASAEKKRASWAVRQEKGNLLEGKEDDWPLRRTSVLPF